MKANDVDDMAPRVSKTNDVDDIAPRRSKTNDVDDMVPRMSKTNDVDDIASRRSKTNDIDGSTQRMSKDIHGRVLAVTLQTRLKTTGKWRYIHDSHGKPRVSSDTMILSCNWVLLSLVVFNIKFQTWSSLTI